MLKQRREEARMIGIKNMRIKLEKQANVDYVLSCFSATYDNAFSSNNVKGMLKNIIKSLKNLLHKFRFIWGFCRYYCSCRCCHCCRCCCSYRLAMLSKVFLKLNSVCMEDLNLKQKVARRHLQEKQSFIYNMLNLDNIIKLCVTYIFYFYFVKLYLLYH